MKEKTEQPKNNIDVKSQGSDGTAYESHTAWNIQETLPRSAETAPFKVGKGKPPLQRKAASNAGLPSGLKAGLESASGYAMDDVKVHYNSPKPAKINALAYSQGSNIHLGPGQEKHLPHEAWHVVQQKQGRVRPTLQMKTGISVNDDQRLEREADIMGERLASGSVALNKHPITSVGNATKSVDAIQMKRGRLVRRTNEPSWFWGESLNATWQDEKVPMHPCHEQQPAPNQLYGGYTIIDSVGETIISRTYGPYKPKSGAKKSGHVERQLIG
ncbi:MAG: DUF4157 domain-containing protein, partial [Bacteroidota bacterium]